ESYAAPRRHGRSPWYALLAAECANPSLTCANAPVFGTGREFHPGGRKIHGGGRVRRRRIRTPSGSRYAGRMTDWQAFTVEIDGHVARVTLTGPGKGNAMGPDFWRELPEIFAQLDTDPQVRAVVLTGSGKHFSYGLDL